MRTTITINDELFRVYKVRAATLGTTLSQEIAQALKRDLERSEAEEPFVLVTAGEGSEPLPGVDYSRNAALQALMDEGLPIEKLR
jgi:hypothetical protein